MIVIKNLNKQYGSKKVVDDVSFEIEKGKITSFIGPNGAGKSTVLSMIARILDKDSGTVTIDDIDISNYKDSDLAKKISILKQSNNINVRLTIKEIVGFGRYPYSNGKLTKDDMKHIDDAIEYMGLSDMKDSYLDELSGGQRQRAFIAMIIAQDTEYVLLDEPLNNLDMKHSVSMMKVFRKLVDELNKTVVIVLHDINFASVYSDNIVVLKNGRIAKDDKAQNIIDKDVLEDIYEIDFEISEKNGRKICDYF